MPRLARGLRIFSAALQACGDPRPTNRYPGGIGTGLVSWGVVHFRLGDWASAYGRLFEATRIARQTGQRAEVANGLAWLTLVEAGLGKEADCREHWAEALEIADELQLDTIYMISRSHLGFLELSLGRVKESIAALEHVARRAEIAGLIDPSPLLWAPDLIEAYTRAGRCDEANAALETLAVRAEQTDRHIARAAAARGRLLLGADHDVDAHYRDALLWHQRSSTPFERARTDLIYGEKLRRLGRRIDARRALKNALDVFEQLGARLWAERARGEFVATGIRSQRRSDPSSHQLTAQEREIARVVGSGATNQEAAAALFLSPKTVEAHLSRVYRKLGLRSRTELALRLTSDAGLLRASRPHAITHSEDPARVLQEAKRNHA
jgi:DNA-binding CsgD family transcriptional regulator